MKYTRVVWKLPPDGWLKCNTDGAFRDTNGRASYAYCVRDTIGDLIYAQAEEIFEVTNNIAKARSIHEALKYIASSHLSPCVIETDSLLMKKVLDDDWEPPWNISTSVDKIK